MSGCQLALQILQVQTPTLSSTLAGKLDNITATTRGGTPIMKWTLNPTAWFPSGSIIHPICFPSILNSGSLYKSPLHAGMVQSVQLRRVVFIPSLLQRMFMPLTRRPRSGETQHGVPNQSSLIVIVGGIEIGKALRGVLREMCLRLEIDIWEAAERSKAADSSRC